MESVDGGLLREKVNGRRSFSTNSTAKMMTTTTAAEMDAATPTWYFERPMLGCRSVCEIVLLAMVS